MLDQRTLPGNVWIRLLDRNRVQRKLRISLTENCNFTCFFCHNEGQGAVQRVSPRAMSVGEITTAVRVAVAEGTTKIKLTGGEPLLYKSGKDGIVELVAALSDLRKAGMAFDLSITTNGSLLPECAEALGRAGLDRVTVSVTTLTAETFKTFISSNNNLLGRTIAGLSAARNAGLLPLKINMALYFSPGQRQGNLAEVHQVVALAMQFGVVELRLFTLLWHDGFMQFDEYYQFFSPHMKVELVKLLRGCDISDPETTVENLSNMAFAYADRVYPKVEFGVRLGSLRLGFEAMKAGRLGGDNTLQEGPYALRLGADGALRTTLNGPPSYGFISGIRSGRDVQELRSLYRAALEEMP